VPLKSMMVKSRLIMHELKQADNGRGGGGEKESNRFRLMD